MTFPSDACPTCGEYLRSHQRYCSARCEAAYNESIEEYLNASRADPYTRGEARLADPDARGYVFGEAGLAGVAGGLDPEAEAELALQHWNQQANQLYEDHHNPRPGPDYQTRLEEEVALPPLSRGEFGW